MARRVLTVPAAVIATVLWAALPISVVQSMGYSESLFTALSVWSLYAVLRQRLPVPLLVYTFALVALTVTASGYFGSKPRYVLPAFPLLFPMVHGWRRGGP